MYSAVKCEDHALHHYDTWELQFFMYALSKERKDDAAVVI
jgi:hypothetical protein